MTQIDFEKRRVQMVDRHIAYRGVRSPLVLEAMRRVPREGFLPEELREFAYEDAPLPIAEEQTISQPYYFEAVLPRQFDEFVWFDETSAVIPLRSEELKGLPDTYPFGL